MRSTAIVYVSREDCPLRTCGGIGGDRPHAFYRATCKDCGEVSDDHIRCVLEDYWVRTHRQSCPKRPGAA